MLHIAVTGLCANILPLTRLFASECYFLQYTPPLSTPAEIAPSNDHARFYASTLFIMALKTLLCVLLVYLMAPIIYVGHFFARLLHLNRELSFAMGGGRWAMGGGRLKGTAEKAPARARAGAN